MLLIPLTSQMDTLRFGASLLIQPTSTNGLATPSVALVFQLGACDVQRLGLKVGQLDDADLVQLRDLVLRFQKLT